LLSLPDPPDVSLVGEPTDPAPSAGEPSAESGNFTFGRPVADAPLSKRYGHTSVWTSSEVLIWSGAPIGNTDGTDYVADDGAVYDPADDAWTPLPAAPIGGRIDHASVWTGSELIVWGGNTEQGPVADGAAFDPAAGRWRTLATSPLSPRWGVQAVWTGREVIVWGGAVIDPDYPDPISVADGAAYDPATDSWRRLADAPLPRRAGGVCVWTGSEVIIGGGSAGDSPQGWGAYNPSTDQWRTLPSPAPDVGVGVDTGVWDGEQLVVVAEDWRVLTLNPEDGVWVEGPESPVDTTHGPVWTHSERHIVLFGGMDLSNGEDGTDVLAFDLVERAWTSRAAVTPQPRTLATVTALDGNRVLLWGGDDSGQSSADPYGVIFNVPSSTPDAGASEIADPPASEFYEWIVVAESADDPNDLEELHRELSDQGISVYTVTSGCYDPPPQVRNGYVVVIVGATRADVENAIENTEYEGRPITQVKVICG
jgi:N-acetylneuraminic acid mutarotase